MNGRELGFAKMALSSLNMDDNFGHHMVVCKVMKSVGVRYEWLKINFERGKLQLQSVEWGLTFHLQNA